MSGLRKICKIYGAMIVGEGKRQVKYVWDYANDEPVKEQEMPFGSERHKLSEQARFELIKAQQEQQT